MKIGGFFMLHSVSKVPHSRAFTKLFPQGVSYISGVVAEIVSG